MVTNPFCQFYGGSNRKEVTNFPKIAALLINICDLFQPSREMRAIPSAATATLIML